MLNRWIGTTISTVERGGHRVGQIIKTLLRPVRTTAALTSAAALDAVRPRSELVARERTPATADSRAGSGGPAATAPVSGGPPPLGTARPRQHRMAPLCILKSPFLLRPLMLRPATDTLLR
jgi:hypothetical protein